LLKLFIKNDKLIDIALDLSQDFVFYF